MGLYYGARIPSPQEESEERELERAVRELYEKHARAREMRDWSSGIRRPSVGMPTGQGYLPLQEPQSPYAGPPNFSDESPQLRQSSIMDEWNRRGLTPYTKPPGTYEDYTQAAKEDESHRSRKMDLMGRVSPYIQPPVKFGYHPAQPGSPGFQTESVDWMKDIEDRREEMADMGPLPFVEYYQNKQHRLRKRAEEAEAVRRELESSPSAPNPYPATHEDYTQAEDFDALPPQERYRLAGKVGGELADWARGQIKSKAAAPPPPPGPHGEEAEESSLWKTDEEFREEQEAQRLAAASPPPPGPHGEIERRIARREEEDRILASDAPSKVKDSIRDARGKRRQKMEESRTRSFLRRRERVLAAKEQRRKEQVQSLDVNLSKSDRAEARLYIKSIPARDVVDAGQAGPMLRRWHKGNKGPLTAPPSEYPLGTRWENDGRIERWDLRRKQWVLLRYYSDY